VALTKHDARRVVGTYLRAWIEQDADLIETIFTHTAIYHERVFDAPIQGRHGIRAYWKAKVIEGQANIECELLNLYLDGDTAIAEWEAEFDDVAQRVRKRMREVAILVFEGGLITSLREYWSSVTIAHLGK
jgi:ketosteroid isomerase-like protein